jgi:hypothetical protein
MKFGIIFRFHKAGQFSRGVSRLLMTSGVTKLFSNMAWEDLEIESFLEENAP